MFRKILNAGIESLNTEIKSLNTGIESLKKGIDQIKKANELINWAEDIQIKFDLLGTSFIDEKTFNELVEEKNNLLDHVLALSKRIIKENLAKLDLIKKRNKFREKKTKL